MASRISRLRQQRRAQRRQRQQGLQLTALMDVFTVLVFFLMVSQDHNVPLPQREDVPLPTASVEKAPQHTPVLHMSQTQVYLNHNPLVSVQELEEEKTQSQARIRAALTAFTAQQPEDANPVLTVMAHKALPYNTIEALLESTKDTAFSQISLAVIREGAQ